MGLRGAALSFWRGMRGHPYVREHPGLPEAHWGSTIPIGLHGDGGAFTRQDSVYVISWNSLVQDFGPTLDTRLLFTVVRKHDMTPATLDQVFKAFSWSLNILSRGQIPGETWDGRLTDSARPLNCGGFRGACCQCRGDWAVFAELFHIPKNGTKQNRCVHFAGH